MHNVGAKQAHAMCHMHQCEADMSNWWTSIREWVGKTLPFPHAKCADPRHQCADPRHLLPNAALPLCGKKGLQLAEAVAAPQASNTAFANNAGYAADSCRSGPPVTRPSLPIK